MTRDTILDRLVTFSRSMTLVPTRTCANACAYCGFRRCGDGVIRWKEVEQLLQAGVQRGRRELLIMSGERPWLVDGFPLSEDEYVDYLHRIGLRALQLGLLPHTNVGLLSEDQLRRLKEVNVSMGLMLESTNDRLPAHAGRHGKRVQERLAHIARAGALRIPFTTGLLIGIGESPDDRLQTLEEIAALQRRYGHIQEVIIQNFHPKSGTPMVGQTPADLSAMLETVRAARALLPGVAIQVPPNLNPDFADLLQAGARDLGGISDEPDEINPDAPWPSLETIVEKVTLLGFHLQERLPVHPAVDAHLAPAADLRRRELVGDDVTYVVNCNVNFTNICNGGCAFCAFCRGANAADAFCLSIPEILSKVARAVAQGASEVCMQGGLNKELGFSFYLDLLRTLKRQYPDLHLHAFSPMEVLSLSRRSGHDLRYILSALKDAGLDSMPGTAAEILVDEVRQQLCPTKLSTVEWVEVIRTAHTLGIPSTVTMMFGHVESWEHRIRHLEIVRNIQRETGGFTELVLLPFVPGNTPLARRHKLGPVPLEEILQLTAYARLYLDRDLVNIQNSWVKIGVPGLLRSLTCGANDFGGTLMEESISRSAGAVHGEYLSPAEIQSAISSIGRVPVQRDTLYNRRLALTPVGVAPRASVP